MELLRGRRVAEHEAAHADHEIGWIDDARRSQFSLDCDELRSFVARQIKPLDPVLFGQEHDHLLPDAFRAFTSTTGNGVDPDAAQKQSFRDLTLSSQMWYSP